MTEGKCYYFVDIWLQINIGQAYYDLILLVAEWTS